MPDKDKNVQVVVNGSKLYMVPESMWAGIEARIDTACSASESLINPDGTIRDTPQALLVRKIGEATAVHDTQSVTILQGKLNELMNDTHASAAEPASDADAQAALDLSAAKPGAEEAGEEEEAPEPEAIRWDRVPAGTPVLLAGAPDDAPMPGVFLRVDGADPTILIVVVAGA